MTRRREATVTIEGYHLGSGQVTALRVACTSWLCELDEGHAAELGEIGRLYQERLREVLAMLVD
jgi:hypothetical protein